MSGLIQASAIGCIHVVYTDWSKGTKLHVRTFNSCEVNRGGLVDPNATADHPEGASTAMARAGDNLQGSSVKLSVHYGLNASHVPA